MRRDVIGMVAAACLAAAAGIASAQEAPREIVVTGEGRVEVAPDVAFVTAGVETEADTAEAALAANAAAMTAVIAAVEAAGVARAEMQTNQLALFPVYREQEDGRWTPEVIGYTARNVLSVRVRALDSTGAVLDAMAGAGTNRIEGISFALADPRAPRNAALERAVEDARAKAELLARAAGVTLGPVVALRETQPFNQPFPAARAQADMAMESALVEGTLAVDAMVEMVLTIAE
jgi:uncharacterized protein YggE